MSYDLVVKGGTIIDPSQGMHEVNDVAFTGGKVAAIGSAVSDIDAKEVFDASNLIVTPGLIDLHVHAFWGASGFGIPPDPGNIAKGVTTAVDAGSAGARTFPAFRKWVIERSDTRLFALLNISSMGMVGGNEIGELEDIRWANVRDAIDSWQNNRDIIVGIKARLGKVQSAGNDVEALRRSLEVADAVGGFVMIHIGNSTTPLEDLCAMLRPGDLVTHSFAGFDDCLINESGRVRPGLKEAAKRGVIFDVGHGGGGFSFINAEKALADGFLPGNISSDLHNMSVDGPVFDLLTTMSKFMYLGLSLNEVIRLSTSTSADIIGKDNSLGTLAVGSEGDATIIRLDSGRFPLIDRLTSDLSYHGVKWAPQTEVVATEKLNHVATVRRGSIYRPWLGTPYTPSRPL